MAQLKGKGFVISALVAGGAAYLSKKQNRDKAMKFLTQVQSKFGSLFGSKAVMDYSFKELAETAAGSSELRIRENNFISEGGSQTHLEYYNENEQRVLN
ncbi:hypothetical protein ACIQ34_18630 [Ureibacillus sp. NPDC094379]